MKTNTEDYRLKNVLYAWEAKQGTRTTRVYAYTKERARHQLERLVGDAEGWRIRRMGFPYPKR